MQTLLGFLHGIDLLLSFWLLGFIFFCTMILPAGKGTGLSLFSDWPQKLQRMTLAALISSGLWLLLTAVEMTEGWDLTEIQTAIFQTYFGHVWLAKILVLALVFLIGKGLEHRKNSMLEFSALLLSATLPLFSTWTGHAESAENQRIFRLCLDGIHSLSVALWSGGLWALYVWLGRRALQVSENSRTAYLIVKRFSRMAMAATGALFLTGLAMTSLAGVSLVNPAASEYGLWVLVKLSLFSITLLMASVNHFVLLARGSSGTERDFVKSLRFGVCAEAVMILVIYLVAGFLSRMPPPV